MKRPSVRIVGAGLIGTSIALKLRELDAQIEIVDADATREKIARDLVGGNKLTQNAGLVVLATPPASTLTLLKSEITTNPNSTFIDVGSVKTNLQREVERFPALVKQFVPTHPIAGRELAGPQGAQADLFEGRAWIITESGAAKERIGEVEEMIVQLGAVPYRMSPEAHDQLFARISHLPQLLSTALALSIGELGQERNLAGSGLRDMIRLAGSDGRLWQEILSENKSEVLEALARFAATLDQLRGAIEAENSGAIIELFKGAKSERDKLSGKHGAIARDYSFVDVVIDDRPGQLAAIFKECGLISVNIEDLALEHSPRQETGLIRLALSYEDANKLHKHLTSLGWRAHQR